MNLERYDEQGADENAVPVPAAANAHASAGTLESRGRFRAAVPVATPVSGHGSTPHRGPAPAVSAPPRVLILVTASMCTMLYALAVTIVNVIPPQLQGALSATPEQVSRVVTLNVIATAVATPMTGWLVARFGQRNVIPWSVVMFTVSSLLCAAAENLAPLLVYRIGQGIFGAPLVPLSQAIIIATYPPERRAAGA